MDEKQKCPACGSTNVALSTDDNRLRCRRCKARAKRTFAAPTGDYFARRRPTGWALVTDG